MSTRASVIGPWLVDCVKHGGDSFLGKLDGAGHVGKELEREVQGVKGVHP